MLKDVVCINDDWAGLDGDLLIIMPKKGIVYTPLYYGPMPEYPIYCYSFECFNNPYQKYFDASHFIEVDSINGQIYLSLHAPTPNKKMVPNEPAKKSFINKIFDGFDLSITEKPPKLFIFTSPTKGTYTTHFMKKEQRINVRYKGDTFILQPGHKVFQCNTVTGIVKEHKLKKSFWSKIFFWTEPVFEVQYEHDLVHRPFFNIDKAVIEFNNSLRDIVKERKAEGIRLVIRKES